MYGKRGSEAELSTEKLEIGGLKFNLHPREFWAETFIWAFLSSSLVVWKVSQGSLESTTRGDRPGQLHFMRSLDGTQVISWLEVLGSESMALLT